jgi:hypothetical protein
LILPTSETVEVSSDWWVLVPRISRVGYIVLNSSARVLSRNHVVEDSQSIPAARVTMVVSELANFVVLRTNISVSMRTDSVDLQIIPVSVSIGATNSVLNEGVIRLSDPETCRSLISIQS